MWKLTKSASLILVATVALTSCDYTWGIEHAPFISGPGPGSRWIHVQGGDVAYDVDLHLPRVGAGHGAPLPFVIVLHGYKGTGPGMERRTRFSELADRAGFVVAYPNGRENARGDRAWTGNDTASADMRMLLALIDSVRAAASIDSTRLYLVGYSNGGGLAHRAAAALPSRFAAVAVVAGVPTLGEYPDTTAAAVPLIAVHGMADSSVPFAGRPDPRGRWLSIDQVARAWAIRDGCRNARGGAPMMDTLRAVETVRTVYGGCRGGVSVELFATLRGRHGWPTAGTKGAPLAATDTIWTFLSRYRRQ